MRAQHFGGIAGKKGMQTHLRSDRLRTGQPTCGRPVARCFDVQGNMRALPAAARMQRKRKRSSHARSMARK